MSVALVHQPFSPGQVRIFVGLDLGQSNDRCALAVMLRTIGYGGASPVTFAPLELLSFDVRFIQRWPVGVAYPDVVARVGEILERLSIQFPKTAIDLVFDRTGVGRPVGDLLRRLDFFCAPREPGSGERRFMPVSLSSGQRETPAADAIGVSVPKRDLVSALVVLFQSGLLRIAEGLPDRRELENELLNFRRFVSEAGRDSYANDGKLAKHDDYVTAVALVAWAALRGRRAGGYFQGGPLPGGIGGVLPF